ncbi:MAG: hypothetical protein ACT4OJ_04850 [Bacteroidota bacterium]
MKEQLNTGYPAHENTRLPLQQLVDGLVGNSLPITMSRNSEVVNEVGRGVILQSVDYRLIGLVDELLTTVITNSRKGDIHISAEKRAQDLVLHIEERNNYNGYALSFSIGTMMGDAALMGGRIDISSPNKLVTVISLSLPGKMVA